MSDIYLSVDVGGSQTKIIYQLKNSTRPNYLLLPPELEEVSKTKLSDYMARLAWIGTPSPREQLWVHWNSRVLVLGKFASEFDPQDRIQELKFENALWKVLGAIGLIVEINQVKLSTKKPLTLELALLLPWNEYSDRRIFEKQLRVMLADFQVRQTALKVSLDRFLCRPEGGGLAALRITQQTNGTEWLQQRRLGVLMFGHRNTTALYFNYGQLDKGDSPLLGFATMLDKVIEMRSGLNRERLAEAIFKSRYASLKEIYDEKLSNTIHPDWSKSSAIIALTTTKDPSLRDDQIKSLDYAIKVATAEYWYKLERWLGRVLPPDLDEVIVGGGAAYHIEPELEKYFNCKPESKAPSDSTYLKTRTGRYEKQNYTKPFVPMIWNRGIVDKIQVSFNLEKQQIGEQCVSTRLVDCFGLFNQLLTMGFGNG